MRNNKTTSDDKQINNREKDSERERGKELDKG